MEAQGLIKQLEELRDTKDYSQSELMNTGYRTGLLDALDLVNKYFYLNKKTKKQFNKWKQLEIPPDQQ